MILNASFRALLATFVVAVLFAAAAAHASPATPANRVAIRGPTPAPAAPVHDAQADALDVGDVDLATHHPKPTPTPRAVTPVARAPSPVNSIHPPPLNTPHKRDATRVARAPTPTNSQEPKFTPPKAPGRRDEWGLTDAHEARDATRVARAPAPINSKAPKYTPPKALSRRDAQPTPAPVGPARPKSADSTPVKNNQELLASIALDLTDISKQMGAVACQPKETHDRRRAAEHAPSMPLCESIDSAGVQLNAFALDVAATLGCGKQAADTTEQTDDGTNNEAGKDGGKDADADTASQTAGNIANIAGQISVPKRDEPKQSSSSKDCPSLNKVWPPAGRKDDHEPKDSSSPGDATPTTHTPSNDDDDDAETAASKRLDGIYVSIKSLADVMRDLPCRVVPGSGTSADENGLKNHGGDESQDKGVPNASEAEDAELPACSAVNALGSALNGFSMDVVTALVCPAADQGDEQREARACVATVGYAHPWQGAVGTVDVQGQADVQA